MRRFRIIIAPWMGLVVGLSGCQHPEVTAVSLNPHYCDHKFAFLYDPCKEPEGIPFYLPKPLLIVAKNFRNVEETKVGLTDSAPIPNFYDDQAKYADLNARTNFSGLDGNAASGTPAATSGNEQFPTGDAKNLASVSTARVYSGTGAPISPGVVAPDGLKPEAFFTYHIMFVPDLTQKYGLKIKGGAGEIRAAMNLVNGWQFTGLGPYYMKDSSTAQNTLAAGITANLAASGVSDVVKAFASLKPGAAAPGGKGGLTGAGILPMSQQVTPDQLSSLVEAMRVLQPRFLKIPAYAEISIYEPYISPEGTMEWKLIAEKTYERDVVATDISAKDVMQMLRSASGLPAASTAQAGEPASQGAPQAADSLSPLAPKPLPLPPSPAPPGAAGRPQSPAGGGVKPLAPGPATSRMAPGHGPPASDVTLQRSSIITDEPGRPKADVALVQTQLLKPATVPVTLSANLSQTGSPLILIMGAPTNAALKLLRGDQEVYSANADQNGRCVMADETAPPGPTTYSVMQVQAGKPDKLLARASMSVPAPTVPEQPPPPIGATTATTFTADLLGRLGPQFAALATTSPAPAAVQPVPVTTTLPTPGAPATGNQVTLNQFFGRTKLLGPAAQAAPGHKRFSLFNRASKERPKTQVVNLAGLDAEVPVRPSSTPSASLGVGNTAPAVLKPTPATPTRPAPAKDDEKIPGTGD